MQLTLSTADELNGNVNEDRDGNRQDLNESQKHALVEVMPSAIYTCDADGMITYFNQRAVELWGRAPKLHDPVDRYCGSFRMYLSNGSLLPHEECPMAVAVHTGRGTRNEEVRILR